MKKLLLIALLFLSCVRHEDERDTCYSFINGTDRNVNLELYSFNSGQFVSLIDSFSINGMGLIDQKCDNSLRILSPVNVYRFDSVIVKFDNLKKLTYLRRFEGQDDEFFFSSYYERDGNSRNFSYTFTEEDYNNAIPF
ncbi:hypothetical protein [Nonlabens tegetincola]|uniref:hypothetical protein n=1 Tax=Nonlabens tegetincola TaxID=323273 RepID=UPI000CF4D73D|nr:hypothetical protein [Nonlabens tegetincola]PQJ20401.1 hypothetical protein BST93_02885 [Nonlabens tegetincola]